MSARESRSPESVVKDIRRNTRRKYSAELTLSLNSFFV